MSDIDRALDSIRAYACYDSMLPLHREAFDEAVKKYAQALALDFIIRLDTEQYRSNARDMEDTMSDIGDFKDAVCREHNIVFVPHEGFVPAREVEGRS